MNREEKKELIIEFLEWINNIASIDPMRLETDTDDIAEMFLDDINTTN